MSTPTQSCTLRFMRGCLSPLLILALILAGCGGKEPPVPQPTSAPTAAPATTAPAAAQTAAPTRPAIAGDAIAIPSGGFVIVPTGALPAGTAVHVTPRRCRRCRMT